LWLIRINPLTQLFKLARYPVYLGVLPSSHIVAASVVISVVTLVVGWFVFNRLAKGFYLHL
jgi:ABC-type polysaccharide/polyol phosphate export permease